MTYKFGIHSPSRIQKCNQNVNDEDQASKKPIDDVFSIIPEAIGGTPSSDITNACNSDIRPR